MSYRKLNSLGEHADIIQKQKDLLKEAQGRKGMKPWPGLKRSRQALVNEFTDLSNDLAMMTLMGRNTVGVASSLVGEAYEPCTEPLSQLSPIRIDDLLLETHHRGRVLFARTFAPPNRLNAVQAGIEDEHGDVERLAVYNLLPDVTPEAFLPPGTVVAIKEPYLKRTGDGGLFVRVDHPSDLVKLPPGDPKIPAKWQAPATPYAQLYDKACKLKKKGNRAFEKKQWQLAETLYSEAAEIAIQLTDDSAEIDDFRRTIHRNRAAARLRLGRYDLAIKDALAAIVVGKDGVFEPRMIDMNTKAWCRAGEAAYRLGDFEQACRHFETGLALHKDKPAKDHPKEIADGIQRCNKRIHKQTHGDYDFAALKRAAVAAAKNKDNTTQIEPASFLANTRIGLSEGKGRGVFTTKAIKAGEIVFAEKAFHVEYTGSTQTTMLVNVNSDRVSTGAQTLLLAGLTNKLMWNPTLADKFMVLCDGTIEETAEEPTSASFVDGTAPVDTFRIQRIVELNAFGCPRVQSGGTPGEDTESKDIDGNSNPGAGVWVHASYVNHSCLPNTARAFIGDMMIVRAVRDLQEGEEIFMTYLGPNKPFHEREETLHKLYGFACSCPLCIADEAAGNDALQKRALAVSMANKFLQTHRLHINAAGEAINEYQMTKTVRREAARRVDDILQTYSDDIYGKLPRLDCIELDLWRFAVGPHITVAPEAQVVLAFFFDILRHCGYDVKIDDKQVVTIDRTFARPHNAAMNISNGAADLLTRMGKMTAAKALTSLAKEVVILSRGADVELN